MGTIANCPHCGAKNNQHSHLADPDRRPTPNSLSLCHRCRRPAIFVDTPEGLALRVPTAEENDAILQNQSVIDALAAMAMTDDAYSALRLWRATRA